MKKQVLMIILVASCAFGQQPESERFIRIINRLIDAMNKQQYASIINEYNGDMQSALPLDKTTIFFQNLQTQYGKVLRADAPQPVTANEMTVVLYFERSMQNLDLYLDNQNKIAGFVVTTYTPPEKPQAAAPQPVPTVSDKQATELLPPFKGMWIVSFGGDEQGGAASNGILAQRYSYEFSALLENGSRTKNNGAAKEDFASFGKDVVAPADGIIADAIDGIPDNEPGKRNPYALIGNAIFLQHPSGEVSVLAYLKQGSIKVKIGEKVTRGQVLAQCGSSGGATEPMLHYHLQNTPSIVAAKQIKFYFERATILVDTKRDVKALYLPKMGDVVIAE